MVSKTMAHENVAHLNRVTLGGAPQLNANCGTSGGTL